jgi:hypothetical protein
MTYTWMDLAKLEGGGLRVVFIEDFDIYPDALVPAGTQGTIVQNNLNEIEPNLWVRPDDTALQASLADWDGCICLVASGDPGNPDDPGWLELSPLNCA